MVAIVFQQSRYEGAKTQILTSAAVVLLIVCLTAFGKSFF